MTQTTPQHLEEAELRAFNNEARTMLESETKTMYQTWYGEAYDPDMTVKECAAAIRKTLRRLAKSKHSPLSGAKVSVRYKSFSGGASIDVKLTVPFRVEATEEEQQTSRGTGKRWHWLTDRAHDAKLLAEQILNAYNLDGSDTQTDYFHVKYYGHVDIREETQ